MVWLQSTYTFKYGFRRHADPSHGQSLPTSTTGAALLCRGPSSRAKFCPKHFMSQIAWWLSDASLVCREKVRTKMVRGSLDLLQMYFQCLRPPLHPNFGGCAVAVDSWLWHSYCPNKVPSPGLSVLTDCCHRIVEWFGLERTNLPAMLRDTFH